MRVIEIRPGFQPARAVAPRLETALLAGVVLAAIVVAGLCLIDLAAR